MVARQIGERIFKLHGIEGVYHDERTEEIVVEGTETFEESFSHSGWGFFA